MSTTFLVDTDWYASPLGPLWLAAQDHALVGLWFQAQAHVPLENIVAHPAPTHPVLRQTRTVLDAYFSGQLIEEVTWPPFAFLWGTPFQQRVWQALRDIPLGETCSYGDVSTCLGWTTRAARAVGSAIARNPIGILVPCHRVVGHKGQLTGYAGGLDKKTWLLRHEAAMNKGVVRYA